MPILFRCEHCGQKISVPSRKAGTAADCPRCWQEITVPVPQARAKKPAAEREATAPTARELRTAREFREQPPSEPAQGTGILPPDDEDHDGDDGFTLRRRGGETDEMDLTPMVDVTFLLLIFFMITASFSTSKTIETPPPDPEKQGAQQALQNLEDLEQTSIMVRIDEQDVIYVDEEPVTDPAGLEDLFADKMRSEEKNELIIQVSPQSRHETFVKVFDAGTGAGMQRIRLATRAEEE